MTKGKMKANGTVEITISLPAEQLGMDDLRQINTGSGAIEGLKLIPVIGFIDPEQVKN